MKKINYNQFQSVYILNDKRRVLVDFLYNYIELYDEDVIFNYEYDNHYEQDSKKIDNILIQPDLNSLNITLITNLDCNMYCVYCYEKNSILNKKNNWKLININYILKFILNEFKMNSYKELNVNVLGGEPLLEKNIAFLNQFFKGIKSICKDAKLGLTSNGINISRYIEYILSWGINRVQITLDGTEKIQNERRVVLDKSINGFEKIQEGIALLLENNIEVFLRVNVDKNNVNGIIDLAKFIIKNNWQNEGLYPYIYPVTISGNNNYVLGETELDLLKMVLNKFKNQKNQIRNLFKFDFHGIDYIDSLIEKKCPNIRTRFCGVSKGQYVILFDGTIFNCWWALGEDIFKIGKIDRTKCDINHLNLEKFAKRNTLEIQRCNVCKFKYICGGGCAYKEYINKGTINKGNCSEFDLLFKEYLNYVL